MIGIEVWTNSDIFLEASVEKWYNFPGLRFTSEKLCQTTTIPRLEKTHKNVGFGVIDIIRDFVIELRFGISQIFFLRHQLRSGTIFPD